MFKEWAEKRKARAIARELEAEDTTRNQKIVDWMKSTNPEDLLGSTGNDENGVLRNSAFRSETKWLAENCPLEFSNAWNGTLLNYEVKPEQFDTRYEDNVYALSAYLASLVVQREDFQEIRADSEKYLDLNAKENLSADEEHQKNALFDTSDLVWRYETETQLINMWIEKNLRYYSQLKLLLIDGNMALIDLEDYVARKIHDMLETWPDSPDCTNAHNPVYDEMLENSDAFEGRWLEYRSLCREIWSSARGEQIHPRQPEPETTASPAARPSFDTTPDLSSGKSALYVFDYDKMSDTYGSEVFGAIEQVLNGSVGVCSFIDGELEGAAGGPSKVPGLLLEIRDNGWMVTSNDAESPLIQLVNVDHIYAYAAGMWTNNPENIMRLHDYFTKTLPGSYLGYLNHPQSLDQMKFYEIFRPLHMPVRMTYVDGITRNSE